MSRGRPRKLTDEERRLNHVSAQKRYRETHKNEIKKYNHDWFQKNRDIRNAQKLRDCAKHRDRVHARNIAYKNVPLGEKCAVCGSTEKLHRHHHDYTKPLEIVTLCEICHLSKKFGAKK